MNKQLIALALSVVAIVLAASAVFMPNHSGFGNVTASFWDAVSYKVSGTSVISSSRGASFTTGAFSSLATLNGGLLRTSTNSTSTTATTQTAVVADFNTYDVLILTPTVGSLAYTLFASSTATTFLPTAGNMQTTCLINGTTTTGVNITLAGGTGTQLEVASSSVTTLGSLVIGPQKIGCLTFTRANSTATTFDLLVAFTTFK